MASSRPIVTGEHYTADDINNLRKDVLDSVGGHSHDGTDGIRIPFANLNVVGAAGSTAPSGGSKSYNDLANHVAASSNVHGLPSNSYACGASTAGVMIQSGTATFSGNQKIVYFNPSFNSGTTPVVVATYAATPTDISNPTETTAIYIIDVTNSRCTVWTAEEAQWGNKPFYWIAVGIKTT